MGKRFGDLEKQAIAILANGGNPAASTDQALAKYWAWKINPSSNDHNLPAASERPNNRKLTDIAIEPFALVLPANIFAGCTYSKRSETAGAGVKTACGIKVLGTNDIRLNIKSFKPARVYWRTGEAAESAARISRITGRTYKSYYAATDEGFSVPFGKVGAGTVAERHAAIKAALPATLNLITFSDEKYRS